MNNSMNFVAERYPWYGGGEVLEEGFTSAVDVLEATNNNWTVDKVPLMYNHNGQMLDSSDYAMIRSDTGQQLGMGKGRYTVVQNQEAFSVADNLMQKGIIKVKAFGNSGAKTWMLAEFAKTEIVKNDEMGNYLFMVNSFDGSSPFQFIFTNLRIICMNMWRAALKSASDVVSLRHTNNIHAKIGFAENAIEMASGHFDEENDFLRFLAAKQVNTSQTMNYLEELFPYNDADSSRVKTTAHNNRNNIHGLIESGHGTDIPGVRGTAFGHLQATIEYTNYHRRTRGDESKRFEANMFGSGVPFINKSSHLLASI